LRLRLRLKEKKVPEIHCSHRKNRKVTGIFLDTFFENLYHTYLKKKKPKKDKQ